MGRGDEIRRDDDDRNSSATVSKQAIDDSTRNGKETVGARVPGID